MLTSCLRCPASWVTKVSVEESNRRSRFDCLIVTFIALSLSTGIACAAVKGHGMTEAAIPCRQGLKASLIVYVLLLTGGCYLNAGLVHESSQCRESLWSWLHADATCQVAAGLGWVHQSHRGLRAVSWRHSGRALKHQHFSLFAAPPAPEVADVQTAAEAGTDSRQSLGAVTIGSGWEAVLTSGVPDRCIATGARALGSCSLEIASAQVRCSRLFDAASSVCFVLCCALSPVCSHNHRCGHTQAYFNASLDPIAPQNYTQLLQSKGVTWMDVQRYLSTLPVPSVGCVSICVGVYWTVRRLNGHQALTRWALHEHSAWPARR
jgi:hypothetical protein